MCIRDRDIIVHVNKNFRQRFHEIQLLLHLEIFMFECMNIVLLKSAHAINEPFSYEKQRDELEFS